jgi:hypothetical protein
MCARPGRRQLCGGQAASGKPGRRNAAIRRRQHGWGGVCTPRTRRRRRAHAVAWLRVWRTGSTRRGDSAAVSMGGSAWARPGRRYPGCAATRCRGTATRRCWAWNPLGAAAADGAMAGQIAPLLAASQRRCRQQGRDSTVGRDLGAVRGGDLGPLQRNFAGLLGTSASLNTECSQRYDIYFWGTARHMK